MRKPVLHMPKQLHCSVQLDDQRLSFHNIDSTFPALSTYKISRLLHLLWLYSPICVPSHHTAGLICQVVVFICAFSKPFDIDMSSVLKIVCRMTHLNKSITFSR